MSKTCPVCKITDDARVTICECGYNYQTKVLTIENPEVLNQNGLGFWAKHENSIKNPIFVRGFVLGLALMQLLHFIATEIRQK